MGEGVSKMAKKIPTSFMDGPYGPAYACLFHTSEAAAVSHSVNNNYRVVDFDYSHLTQKYVMFFTLSCFFGLFFVFTGP